MKSFKEYILDEDINNWIVSQLTSKYKNGNVHINLNDKNIDAAVDLWKQEHPNDSEEAIKDLDKEKIKEMVKKVNARKSANKAFSGDDNKEGEFTKLAKEGNIPQFINKIKKYTNSENSELKAAASNALDIASKLNAASVVTEATDDNEELVKAAEKVDAIIKSLGDKYKYGTPGEKSAIENELALYISNLAKDVRNISSENGGEILKTLINAADKNKDKKLTSLEVRDYVSTNSNIKDGTNLKFILALLWFKTQNVEMYKKALLTDSGSAKANGVGESVLKQYNKLVTGVTNLSLGEDIMKLIGGNISGFSDIEEFSNNLSDAAKALSKPLSENERNKLRANNSDNTDNTAHTDNQVSSNSETPAPETSSESDNEIEAKVDADIEAAKGNSNENGNSSSTDLYKLSPRSTPEQVRAAVNKAFGRDEDGQGNPEENDTLLKSVLTKCSNEQKKNDELYNKSHRQKEQVSENVIFDAIENNKLVSEGLKDTLRRAKNNGLVIGRSNISAEHTENAKGGWKETRDEMIEINNVYYNKAKTIVNKYGEITGTSQRHSLLIKLKEIRNKYSKELTDSLTHAMKRNRYSELGAMKHDARKGAMNVKDKAYEIYKNSSLGRANAMDQEDAKNKASKIDSSAFKDFDEKVLPIICHAVKVGGNPNDEKMSLMSFIDPKKKNIDFALEQMKSSPAFQMDSKKLAFMLKELQNKMKEDSDFKQFILDNADKLDSQIAASKLADEFALVKPSILKVGKKIEQLKAFFSSLKSESAKQDIRDAANSGSTDAAKRDIRDAANSNNTDTDAVANSVVTEEAMPQGLSEDEKRGLMMAIAIGGANIKDKDLVNGAIKQLASINGIRTTDVQQAINKASENNPNYVTSVSKNINTLIEKSGIGNAETSNQNQQGATDTTDSQNQNNTGSEQQKPTPTPTPTPTTGNGYLQSKGINNDNDFTNAMGDLGSYSVVTTNAVGDSKIPDRLYKQLIRRKIKSFM